MKMLRLFSPVSGQSRIPPSGLFLRGFAAAMAGGRRTPSGPIPWTGPAVLCDLAETRSLPVSLLRLQT